MLYPTEHAIRVSEKAERCSFLVAEKQRLAERQIIFEQEVCSQRLRINDEATNLKLESLKTTSTSPWMIAMAYVAGVATVVLGAWVAGRVSK